MLDHDFELLQDLKYHARMMILMQDFSPKAKLRLPLGKNSQ
jgi:hypothetical protein